MKILFTLLLLLVAATVSAQKSAPPKDSTKPAVRVTAATHKDSIIQPTVNTPLLSYGDLQYLRDSALQNMPYKYAPIIDQILEWLTQRIRLRANEYIQAQTKKPK